MLVAHLGFIVNEIHATSCRFSFAMHGPTIFGANATSCSEASQPPCKDDRILYRLRMLS